MDLFGVLSLVGGLALFLFGMTMMGDGLTKIAGSRLEIWLEKLTATPLRGVLLGAAVTAIIQSSSATSVMVVGFVNSGIMKLSQAAGIIFGANIGTTITSWILSLTGISGDNTFIQMLKPSSFTPILALIGIVFYLFIKNENKKDIGAILLSFSVLMFGMETMSSAVKPLSEVPEFKDALVMFSNPFLGLIIGALFTAAIQSSSASVGILQALTLTGTVTYATAVPIIMGQNVGTCITALLSAVGAKPNAKRAAAIHLYFNIIGVAVFMILFYGINYFLPFKFLSDIVSPVDIAIFHSIFNVTAVVVLLPFTKQLEKLAYYTIKDNTPLDEQEEIPKELLLLDNRFLEQPGVAVAQCITVSDKMAQLSRDAIHGAIKSLAYYDEKYFKRVLYLEQTIDLFEDMLGTYIVSLSQKNLSIEDSKRLSIVLHSISNFERISDHAMNLVQISKDNSNKEVYFSNKCIEELKVYLNAVEDIVNMTIDSYINHDIKLAEQVEPLEEVIDNLTERARRHHVRRLESGECNIDMAVTFGDLVTDLERISDHCSNIAVCLIEITNNVYDTHDYIDTLKETQSPKFQELYQKFNEKYHI